MKVLFVSAEAAPFAKVGGLADVAGALPKALRRLGHDARLVMPLYRMIEDDPRWRLQTTVEHFDVEMNPRWTKGATFKETEHDGLPVGFIGTDEWYTEAVSSETLYYPGGMQHLFFCAAVIKAMEELDWIPDVIHVNDWHTGFLPVLLKEKAGPRWANVPSVFTIHNLAYQGEFGLDALEALGLPHSLFHYERTEAYGYVNFLKAGCAYADRVNTVSENYACEIQTAEFGARLEGLMRHLAEDGRLSGILNGIDTDVFNPATDLDIPFHFSADEPANKARNRAALLKELDLPVDPATPLFGVVSRLSSQKGLDLIVEAAETLFDLPIRLVIQGLGDPKISKALRDLEKRFPQNFRFVEAFDAPLAQRVYAGCDGFLMPSAFEPCGLGQMIAMRYGTVPVVRRTGGLADTVFEGVNGFVFDRLEPMALVAAVTRAADAYSDPGRWQKIMLEGMTSDFGWDASAKKYARLYRDAHADLTEEEAKTA
ncbi:glycogen synthase [Fimbriimonas ginsengisoli]|uniref:Glycogen synthase n=1 Tax=Fimbriimonas ginsengisoli Gsoil 348 TaxID=661478 RepID=A0A068NTI5_FIMGI|nr:glycogen/starch synthase [Fimbriimonas ginsengisoli]AIE86868.1 glycogen/starch synthase [Fimbriimonas ginsengisoli Gsoil 348]